MTFKGRVKHLESTLLYYSSFTKYIAAISQGFHSVYGINMER